MVARGLKADDAMKLREGAKGIPRTRYLAGGCRYGPGSAPVRSGPWGHREEQWTSAGPVAGTPWWDRPPGGVGNCSRCAGNLSKFGTMTSVDQPDPALNAEAAELQSEMDSELAGLQEKTSGPVTSHLNPVFQHEQRAGTAADEGEATETAARVAGEIGPKPTRSG